MHYSPIFGKTENKNLLGNAFAANQDSRRSGGTVFTIFAILSLTSRLKFLDKEVDIAIILRSVYPGGLSEVRDPHIRTGTDIPAFLFSRWSGSKCVPDKARAGS